MEENRDVLIRLKNGTPKPMKGEELKMKKYYVDFSAWIEVEADSAENAREEFGDKIFDHNSLDFKDVNVDCVEEEEC